MIFSGDYHHDIIFFDMLQLDIYTSTFYFWTFLHLAIRHLSIFTIRNIIKTSLLPFVIMTIRQQLNRHFTVDQTFIATLLHFDGCS